MKTFKIILLLAGFSLFLLLLGDLLAGHAGVILAFFLMLLMNINAYWYSDKSALRLYRAPKWQNVSSQFDAALTALSEKAGMSAPKLYVIESDASNMLTVGNRNSANASIVITTGLTRLLNTEELTAVFAHGLSLIRSKSAFENAVIASVASGICGLANWNVWKSFFVEPTASDEVKVNPVIMKIVAPLSAFLVRMVVTPDRVFAADRVAVELCGNPNAFLSALEKIKSSAPSLFLRAETHPATAHLCFVNPLCDEKLRTWFNTFPGVVERIKNLAVMEATATA